MMTEQLTQALSIQDAINSQTINNTSVESAGCIDMSRFKRAMYIVSLSSAGAAGAIAGNLQSCFESNFAANVHNITNSNLTNLNTNNNVTSVEVRSDQVTQQNAADRYVRLVLTGSGNIVTASAVGLGGEAVQLPGGQNYDNDTPALNFVTLPRQVVNT
jgi:hypothetical protein